MTEETGNILFDAYVKEKEKDIDILIEDWAKALWRHYTSFLKVGFTEEQSIQLLEIYWKRADELQWRRSHDQI